MAKIKIITICCSVSALIIFGLDAQAADNYDLKAESLIMNSAKCDVNQVCSFTARVKNLGSDFTLNFPLKSTVSGASYKTDSPTVVSPAQGTTIKTNDYLTFSIYGAFSQIGSIILTFAVNPAGYLAESNGNNNSASLTVNVAGYDLAVEPIIILPANPMVNQNCYVKIKVKNNSTYNLYTETGLNLTRSFPDFTIDKASSTSPSLANVIHYGDYLYWGYEGRFTSAGEKLLSFTIDPDDDLGETNLTNNLSTKKIIVYNAADTDLAIDSIVFSAERIVLGTPFDITIGVKNLGKTSLTDAAGLVKSDLNFSLPYFEYGVNDLTIDSSPTLGSPFNPTGIFHYKYHGAFSRPGNFNLAFSINKDKQLVEANYNNNATTTPIKVYKSLAEADNFSILSKSVKLVSSTTAIISWTTDLKTTGVLNYGLTTGQVSDNKVVDSTNVLSHSLTVNYLRPGAKYSYMITANNGTAQQLDMQNDFTPPVDDLLIIVSSPSLLISGQSATTSWNTNLISSGQVYYRQKGASSISAAGSAAKELEHKVALNNLAYGQYDYFVSSTSTPGANVKTDWASFEIWAAPSAPASTTIAVPAHTVSTVTPAASFAVINSGLYEKLKGKIILKVQSLGEAYYISPKDKKLYSLGKPEDAFQVIRRAAVGMTNNNLAKIPVGLSALSGADADSDGLPDALETALGANPNKRDTDADGFSDQDEIATGYSPLEKNKKLALDNNLAQKFKGQILLQVESRGQAWYINPADRKRYFLARPADAFNIMRQLGVGVTNKDYQALGGK